MEKEIVDSKKYHDGAFSIKISSRELVKLTFQNLHPFHAPSFWEKNNFTTTPSMIFFRGKKDNVLAHGFLTSCSFFFLSFQKKQCYINHFTVP